MHFFAIMWFLGGTLLALFVTYLGLLTLVFDQSW